MPSYSAGTITLTSGSLNVVGTATDFVANAAPGYLLRDRATAQTYPILSITDATHLVLEDNVLAAAAGSGRSYSIVPTSLPIRDLTTRVGELLDDFSDIRDTQAQGTYDDLPLQLRRTDNTATFLSHIDLKRGSGAGTAVSIRTRGDTANGADYIEFAFGGTAALNLDKSGALNIVARTPATLDAQITFNRAASTSGLSVGRQTAFAYNSAAAYVGYGYSQFVINSSTAGAHTSYKQTAIAKAGALQVATQLIGDEHQLRGAAPYYSFSNQGGTVRLGYIQHGGTDLTISNDQSGAILFGIGVTEVMRINPSSQWTLGTTSPTLSGASCRATISYPGGGTQYGIGFRPTTDSTYPLWFANAAGSTVGSISTNASATSFNTSSDYRLKEDDQSIENAIERVMNLRPVNFRWIATGQRVDGFFAHEAAEVVPEAVTGEKDAVEDVGTAVVPAYNRWAGQEAIEVPAATITGVTEAAAPEGSTWTKTGERPVYQAIDQAKLVPVLTAALQAALNEIATIKARLTAAGID